MEDTYKIILTFLLVVSGGFNVLFLYVLKDYANQVKDLEETLIKWQGFYKELKTKLETYEANEAKQNG